MNLAIIPARAGSKRIPRKNIKHFRGKPVIAYAIEAAISSGIFDRVIVSTDDDEIAEVAEVYGASCPFVRPSELSDDYTPTVPVIAHAIRSCEKLGWDVGDVCCIYPAAPFLHHRDLQEAHDELVEGLSDFVFPVAEFPSPIQRALRRHPDGAIEPFLPEHAETRTQDLDPGYFDAGQFYWGRKTAWLAGRTVHLNARALIIPTWRAIDIDTLEDWKRAEMLYDCNANSENC